MLTMDIWEKPILAIMLVNEVAVAMVLIVRDVFPDNLPELPPNQEIEFRIDILPGTTLISKVLYWMAPIELQELKI